MLISKASLKCRLRELPLRTTKGITIMSLAQRISFTGYVCAGALDVDRKARISARASFASGIGIDGQTCSMFLYSAIFKFP